MGHLARLVSNAHTIPCHQSLILPLSPLSLMGVINDNLCSTKSPFVIDGNLLQLLSPFDIHDKGSNTELLKASQCPNTKNDFWNIGIMLKCWLLCHLSPCQSTLLFWLPLSLSRYCQYNYQCPFSLKSQVCFLICFFLRCRSDLLIMTSFHVLQIKN